MSVLATLLAALCLQDRPADRLRAAIENVRAQKSFIAKFKARIEAPNSDPLDVTGVALQVNPDLLFIDYHASGGQVKFIVRKGARTKQWHTLAEDWVDSEQIGDGTAARGLQNPQEVFDALLKNLDLVQAAGAGTLTLKAGGERFRDLIKDMLDEKDVRWKESRAEVSVALQENLITTIRCRSEIAWKEPRPIISTFDITLEDWNKHTEYKFVERDAKGNKVRDVLLTEEVKRELGIR